LTHPQVQHYIIPIKCTRINNTSVFTLAERLGKLGDCDLFVTKVLHGYNLVLFAYLNDIDAYSVEGLAHAKWHVAGD